MNLYHFRGVGIRVLAARLGLVSLFALALVACSSDEDSYVERPVEELYNRAMDDLEAGNNGSAAIGFDEVERQHPYSVWANKAQIMSAYAHYLSNSYDEAILAAERFIQLHPGSREVPYAYYITALCYYEQISDVGRDQMMTQNALNALDELVRRFPRFGVCA